MGNSDQITDLTHLNHADEPGMAVHKAVPTTRRKTTTIKPSAKIRVRILWPALGFPEVVAPNPDATSKDVGDTGRIKLLLVTDKSDLTAMDIAEYLRYVPWKDRTIRYLPKNPGKCSFSSKDIWLEKVNASNTDDMVEQIYFATGEVVASLSKFVRNFYKQLKLEHLYQVCISEQASAKLKSAKSKSALYQLFWARPGGTGNAKLSQLSDEMKMLIDDFAKKRKRDTLGCGRTLSARAYEYALTLDDSTDTGRVEVLHPLFVWSNANRESVQFAHMTDTHVVLRAETFERNLKNYKKEKDAVKSYNNYNARFKELYAQAKGSCDVLLMTGDLVDYTRGYLGGNRSIGDEKSYALDVNWFYFYGLLVHDKSGYTKPVYTVLGNHDWRVDPFYPLNPIEKQDVEMNLTEEQMKHAHGWMPSSYAVGGYSSALGTEATITDIDAIKWYLLLINPFLDYTPRLPGGYSLLMLDWVRDEEVFIKPSRWSWLPLAENSLTDIQISMASWFVNRKSKANVLGLHAAIVSPWPEWSDEALNLGLIRPCPRCGGSSNNGLCGCRWLFLKRRDGSEEQLIGTRYAKANSPYQDEVDTDEDVFKLRPAYASIKKKRDWLINAMQGKVSLVCCGHVHRNSIFVVLQPGNYKIEGNYSARNRRQHIESDGNKISVKVYERQGNVVKEDYYGSDDIPASTAVRIADLAMLSQLPDKLRPVYLNTTSAGPVARARKRDGVPLRVPPGYSEIVLDAKGKVLSVKHINSKNVKPLQWECWLRKPSKAKWVKLHDGGIIAGYDRKQDASAESAKEYGVWQKGAEYECWLQRKSAAAEVKLHTQDNSSGIIGVYFDNEGYEAAKKEKRADEPWQKWPGSF